MIITSPNYCWVEVGRRSTHSQTEFEVSPVREGVGISVLASSYSRDITSHPSPVRSGVLSLLEGEPRFFVRLPIIGAEDLIWHR